MENVPKKEYTISKAHFYGKSKQYWPFLGPGRFVSNPDSGPVSS